VQRRAGLEWLTGHFEPLQDQNQTACDCFIEDFLSAHGIELFVGCHSITVTVHSIHVWSSSHGTVLIVLELKPTLKSIGTTGLRDERSDMC
jgi:hypothetical protein